VNNPDSGMTAARTIALPGGFSLAQTCGPVDWARGRWPNIDWREGRLFWVGWESGRVVHRTVSQDGDLLLVAGDAEPAEDRGWAARVLGIDRRPPILAEPVVAPLGERYAGLRPFAAGSLWDGIVSSIAGQSISVAAAAVTEARLAALFDGGIELDGRRFWPMPTPEQVAAAEVSLVRTSGVTWRRAAAIVGAAQAWLAEELPANEHALAEPDVARAALRRLPLVGPWTAESALLWGLGEGDAFPPNDAALLRAARRAYGRPELDQRGLTALAERWRPGRAWAARWIWTDLLGVAG